MNLKELITEYLVGNKHLQLCTVKDGQPWICTVYFAADNDLNLYWMSARSRRHSVEILNNPVAAVTVVRSTELKQALQITGNAYEVSDDDLERVHNLYTTKFGPKPYNLSEIKKRLPEGRSYWIFKPTTIMLWDEVNFPNAPKQQYQIPKIA